MGVSERLLLRCGTGGGRFERTVVPRGRAEDGEGWRGAGGGYIIQPLQVGAGRCERTFRGSARLLWRSQPILTHWRRRAGDPALLSLLAATCLRFPSNPSRAAADGSRPSPRPATPPKLHARCERRAPPLDPRKETSGVSSVPPRPSSVRPRFREVDADATRRISLRAPG